MGSSLVTFTKSVDIAAGSDYNLGTAKAGTAGATPAAGGAAAGEDDKQLDCDTRFTNPLTWVICPVIDLLADTVDVIDGWITDLLEVDSDNIFCENKDSCTGYHNAWSSFRDIALWSDGYCRSGNCYIASLGYGIS